ncbi:MAG: hypothetical protein ACFBWO_14265 [Paracoccaceae bacterium]
MRSPRGAVRRRVVVPPGGVRPGAFARAAIATPLAVVLGSILVALLCGLLGFVVPILWPAGFLVVAVALGAVVLGLPSYTLFGLPLAWYALGRWHRHGRAVPGRFLVVGLVANLPTLPLFALAFDKATPEAAHQALFLTGLGFLFGPVLGIVFALLYWSFVGSRPDPLVERNPMS